MSLRNITIVCNNAGNQTNLTIEEMPSPNWNVGDLKKYLAQRLELASSSTSVDEVVSRIRLIFRGQPLQDATSLSSIAGLTDDTTIHMLVRPAPATSSTTASSSSSSTSRNTNNLGNLEANLDGAAENLVNQLLGGIAGATANATTNRRNNNNTGGNNNNADLGSLVSGLLQGVLGGNNNNNNNTNASNNTNNNTTTGSNNNATTTRTTTIGNTTVRVHDLTGGNNNNNNQQQQQRREREENTTSNQQNRNQNNMNVTLPSALVHVHVTPDQLDALPDQLARFYENFSQRTGANSVYAQNVQLQVEQQQGNNNNNSSSPIGNLINGISRMVSNIGATATTDGNITPVTTNNDSAPQQQQQQQNSSSSTTNPYANITPARPFVSQSNMVSLQERVTNAVKETVSRHGVGALLPLINGDWEPLSLFRAPIASALRQPYMTSASQESVAAALFGEFEQATSSSVFAANGDENPLYRVLEAELSSSSSPDAASASTSTSTTTRQIFDRIQAVLTQSMVEGVDLILPAASGNSQNENAAGATRWSAQVRNLVVRTSGRVVNVLRQEANLSQESVGRILTEVANIAAPMLGQLNPMMSMMVQSNGPMLIQQWADEYNANPENFAPQERAAVPSSTSAPAQTAAQTSTATNNNNNEDSDSDLDALLNDALDDMDGNNTAGASAHVIEVNVGGDDDDGSGADVATALSRALQQVEGLDPASIQSILQMTGQALGGTNQQQQQRGGSGNNAGGYFY